MALKAGTHVRNAAGATTSRSEETSAALARWTAVVTRDRAADGTFVYSVRTTGVYCRPSCGARRPNAANVLFHATAGDAERAGFRPCRRCRPDQAGGDQGRVALVARICRQIEASASPPRLAALADQAGLSAYHFHRVFKAVTGVTPGAYAAAQRARRLRRHLDDRSKSVTEAIYDAGFGSAGRFYAASRRLLGMTPGEYRAGGPFTVLRFGTAACSLGHVLVAHSGHGIAAILLGDRPADLERELRDRFPRASIERADEAFGRVVAEVVRLIEEPRSAIDLPLDVRGTAFQQRVWQALRDVPAGTTTSYAEIAARLGMPGGARAVARACAANPLAVAVPCHRVVRSDGAISGYRWGIDRKRKLLEAERKP